LGNPAGSVGVGVATFLLQEEDMANETVEEFMTRCPYTIGQEQTLATARKLLNEHRIRHLPVLHGGRLSGLLSQRDLYFLESLAGVDSEEVEVSEAMSTEVYTTTPRASLKDVAEKMAKHKYGAAVVVDESGKVIGVFTDTDALFALNALLA
jgi:acetoin utilization protein AcuB